MKLWGRNGKFAFVGVILIAIGIASALSVQEVCRSLRLNAAPSIKPAIARGPAPLQDTHARQVRNTDAPQATVSAVSLHQHPRQDLEPEMETHEMTIHVQGDANTITVMSSSFANKTSHYQLDGDAGTSSFYLGPKQTALVELMGDANTVRVAAGLKERVTIVNNGNGNQIAN